MALAGLVAANNLGDVADIEKSWDSIGSNISATVFVATPSLDLNFATSKSLVDGISGQNLVTFSRASTGTFVGSNGLVQTAASGVPRFDHNGATGESLGLLIEEARTNNLPYSQGFTSGWDTNYAQVMTGQTDPTGGTNAILVKQTNGTSTRQHIRSDASTSIAANFTVSVFVKYVNYDYVILTGADQDGPNARMGYLLPKLRFQFSTETIAYEEPGWGGTSTLGYGFQKYANGWYRLWLTRNTAVRTNYWGIAVQSNPYVGISDLDFVTGDNSSSVLVFGFQVEQGAFPTSYIPTSGATVTRAVDVASIQGSNFGTSKNLITYPEDFASIPPWNGGARYLTATTVLPPLGQTTATLMTEDNSLNEHIHYLEAVPVSTVPQTFSVFVKPSGRTNISLRVFVNTNNWVDRIFNLTGSGSVSSSPSGVSADFTISNQSITQYNNDWYRISITTAQPSTRNVFFSIDLCTSPTPTIPVNGAEIYTGDPTKGVYLWGAQREFSPAVTAYSTYLPVSNWFNADTGTFFAKGFAKDASNAGYATYFLGLGVDTNLSTNTGSAVLARYPGTNYPAIIAPLNGDESERAVGVLLPSYPAAVTIAAAFQNNNSVMAGNGMLSPLIIGKALAKNVNYMRIGANRSGASCINSTISRIAFWPACLPSITLKALSSSNVVSSFTYPLSITGKDILALKEVKNTSIRDFVFIKKLTSKAQPRITVAAQYTASGVALRNAAMPKIAPVTRGNYFFSSGLTLSGVSCQINGTNARSIATSPFSGSTATVPLLFAGLRPQTNWRISETMASGVVTSPENAIPIETSDFLLFIKAGQS
jgi:hypothetical protein